MRFLGRHRFVAAWLEHAPGAVLISAAIVPIVQAGGAYWVGTAAAAIVTRKAGGFTGGLFAAVGAVAPGPMGRPQLRMVSVVYRGVATDGLSRP